MKKSILAAAMFLTSGMLIAQSAHAIDLTGWTGTGSFGKLGADGVVGLSPTVGSSQYGWVSTNGGPADSGLKLGSTVSGFETNGTRIKSPVFHANSGDSLKFYFDFVTSDGAQYADYAWAQLLKSNDELVALLFTARTTPGGDTVPGHGMPGLNATLTPSSTPIVSGTTWSPLGGSSGACYSGGCGNTNWILASYDILNDDNYKLEIGVVNWLDTNYQTGMAFDGATIAGVPIGQTPEPAAMLLMGTGLAGLMGVMRKRKA